MNEATEAHLSLSTTRGRLVVAATVLGSSLAFIDATVVNIALPSIGDELGASSSGLTWVVNGYTLTLASLILLAGSLSDQRGQRRVFALGVAWFALASLACAVAPTLELLVVARLFQGIGGALLTPGSLAILHTTFGQGDRARAIGMWSGLTGVAGAIGPFVGGWLVDVASWRWIFLINLPVAAVVLLLTARVVPETPPHRGVGHFDVPGAALVAATLGALTLGLTSWPSAGLASPATWLPLVLAVLAGMAFVVQERRASNPLLPLGVFSSGAFVSINLVTLLVYAALGGTFLWLVIALQVVGGMAPLPAGLSLLPVTVLMLLFSGRAGLLGARLGPRLPMVAGTAVAAVGVAGLTRIGPGVHYVPDVLVPVVLVGTGLTLAVTPLTAAVLDALPEEQSGIASGVNNAVARTGGLVCVAALPLLTGLGARGFTDASMEGPFHRAMWWCAGFLVLGSLLSAALVSGRSRTRPPEQVEEVPEPQQFSCGVCGPPASARDRASVRD